MAGAPLQVGIREFRESLSSYLEQSEPIAITRHGETIGFYVPARQRAANADWQALQQAATTIQALLAKAGVSEEELVRDSQQQRRKKR